MSIGRDCDGRGAIDEYDRADTREWCEYRCFLGDCRGAGYTWRDVCGDECGVGEANGVRCEELEQRGDVSVARGVEESFDQVSMRRACGGFGVVPGGGARVYALSRSTAELFRRCWGTVKDRGHITEREREQVV